MPSPDSGLAPDWRESQAISEPVDFSVARPLLSSHPQLEETVGEKWFIIDKKMFEKAESRFTAPPPHFSLRIPHETFPSLVVPDGTSGLKGPDPSVAPVVLVGLISHSTTATALTIAHDFVLRWKTQ